MLSSASRECKGNVTGTQEAWSLGLLEREREIIITDPSKGLMCTRGNNTCALGTRVKYLAGSR